MTWLEAISPKMSVLSSSIITAMIIIVIIVHLAEGVYALLLCDMLKFRSVINFAPII